MKIAVRGWPEPEPAKYTEKEFQVHKVRRRLLVFDTETTPDQIQKLTFGSAKVAWLGGKDLLREPKFLEEVIFHADNLPDSDPDGYKVLADYCQERKLKLISQHEFCIKYLNRCVDYVDSRTGKTIPSHYMATLFNLPFDVSRCAYGYGRPKGASYKGGFSFRMFKEGDTAHPTFTVKSLDSRKSFVKGFNGLDVRTLVSALTDKSLSLRKAGELFSVPEEYLKTHAERYDEITPEFIDYNRQDVTATAYLALTALRQYHENPVAVKPQDAKSAASLGKAYLEAMNIPPLLARDVPKDNVDIGNMWSAFFGGRSECRIRNVPCPVAVLDFQSMYPTVNALMGLWDFVTAASIRKEDVTGWAREFFGSLTLDDVLNKETWPQLTGFALIKPDGDLLPVRADYEDNGTWTVGLNYVWSDTPLWYSFPDLAQSKILTGKTPEIIAAVQLIPGEKLPGLRKVKLPGAGWVDPAKEDFFRRVIEQRIEIKATHPKPIPKDCTCSKCGPISGLKCLASGTSYGVYAEMNREDLDEKIVQAIYGAFPEPWEYEGSSFEKPGKYAYPPIAALITGAARLMLAILERMVTDAGGAYVFTDTDSMAVLSGGPSPIEGVRALSENEITEIRTRINALNPYKGEAGKSVLKLEHSCYAYAISAKRYTLFHYVDGKPVIPEEIDGDKAYKEHALGIYLDPTGIKEYDWMREAWQYLLDKAHDLDENIPEWLGKPALIRNSVTRPSIMDRFRDLNEGRAFEETVPYQDRIKPFSFLLMASESGLESGKGRRIITGYSSDPQEWLEKDWYDLHDPDAPPLRVGRDIDIQTMNMVLINYRLHPESKSLGPNGRECELRTSGLLKRREVTVTEIRTIGKESNRLEDQQYHMVASPDEVYTDYGIPDGRIADSTRWCQCGCGTPVPSGKRFLNESHSRMWRRHQWKRSYEISDNELEGWTPGK